MKKLVYLLLALLLTTRAFAQNEFITRWNLANVGSGNGQLFLVINSTGPVSYTWTEVSPGSATGSGTLPGSLNILTGLPAGATIDLSISPTNFSNMIMGISGEGERLIDVRQWGTTAWTSMQTAFLGCPNLQISATDVPNLSLVTSMARMFSGCTALNGPANIGTWNTASVTNMSSLFERASAFNQPIGTWNTANVTDMGGVFFEATAFNQPIGSWNTANVLSMNSMLSGAEAFNQPIGNWNTDKVTDMRALFLDAHAFNQPIGSWNTANVTGMALMFTNALAFNQPIGSWNTTNVTGMAFMFNNAKTFNQPIAAWNTGNVTDMSFMFQDSHFNQPIIPWNTEKVTTMRSMFANNTLFNQSIGIWNTASVTDMTSMFAGAKAFNQPIGSWNTAKVTTMNGMFENASVFNQPIGTWNTVSVRDMNSMFLSAPAFNQPIGTWNTTNVTTMESMFQAATKFNQAIGGWNVANVLDMSSMFFSANAFNQQIGDWTFNPDVNLGSMLNDSGLDCTNYSASLIGWSNNALTPNDLVLGAFQRPYGTNAVVARTNLISNKGWTIDNDEASGTNCALPVRLISFTGQQQGNAVLLNWKTAGEENNAGFEIERSADARKFEKIGFIDGSGDASEVRKYEFTDLYPFPTTYYRLKQIDGAAGTPEQGRFDGTFEYSSIISVKNDAALFGIYPNPAQNHLFVRNPAPYTEVSISDMEGKLLLKKKIKAATPIDINGLPPGLFVVKVGLETQKLVIQR
jgi:surface protein